MLSLGEVKLGTIINIDNEPYQVVSSSHVHMGRGKAVLQTKLKGLVNNKVIERSFKDGDKIEPANLERRNANYLYSDENNVYFMDKENFETISLDLEKLGGQKDYLKESLECIIFISNNEPVKAELPVKIAYKVISSPPGVKGDTASGATKPVVIETGMKIQAPLFIKEGDVVKVNTQSGQYVERVNT